MSLLVVGSMAYDAVETPFAQTDEALGGSAMFFATAASYFTAVNLVAVVGEDFRLDDIYFLRQKNVNFDGLAIKEGATFRWGGKYLDNMIDRETLYTHLGVFASFEPVLPAHYKSSNYIFLANIQPELQHDVVQQIDRPKFVAMDTMNFWITGAADQLKKTLAVVDCLVINDSEVRLLSGENNIFIGARAIQNMGPKTLIIKKGEHGSILVHNNAYFICPAIPVEKLYDPTGAGDTFAGGFMGYLAMVDALTEVNLRRAVVVGTVMASFCVESFSADRLKLLTEADIRERITRLLHLIKVEADNHWLTT